MPFIDFAELKSRVSMEETVARLGIKTTKSGNQLRAPCPSCKSGGDRALAITPAKSLFYCFAAQAGGDQIQLTSHVRNVSAKEAAEWLGGTVQNSSVSGTSTGTVSKEHAGLAPLDYLEHEHPAVEAVGFDPATALALGIGYASKGIMRGQVAVPVRLSDGTLAGYIGVTEAKLPPRWHLPTTNVIPLKKGVA